MSKYIRIYESLCPPDRISMDDPRRAERYRNQRDMDVIERINRWLENEQADDADQTLRDARNEIVALRAMLTRERESASEAVRLMTDNASRYGFLLGGLEMVVAGHTTSARVLETAKQKYGAL